MGFDETLGGLNPEVPVAESEGRATCFQYQEKGRVVVS